MVNYVGVSLSNILFTCKTVNQHSNTFRVCLYIYIYIYIYLVFHVLMVEKHDLETLIVVNYVGVSLSILVFTYKSGEIYIYIE